MKTNIEQDEWYPVYVCSSQGDQSYDIPDDVYKKYQRILREFLKMQGILEDICTGKEKN